jgi:hypothetical protein
MNINIYEEILWPQFVTIDWVRKLPLNEQVKRYNIYLDQLNTARFESWYSYQPKGDEGPQIVQTGFLQQEDLNYILQEDGSKIYITSLI